MRAIVVERFEQPPKVREVPEPVCPPDGVVVTVEATGLCRSDWHGWMGHDPDIVLPHVPGHEFAGVVAEVGPQVRGWRAGQRVTAPFVCACGRCATCASGNYQVCENQEQPGFTYWGSFAERVVVPVAGVNLVELPEALPFAAAAGLGCRFATAYRAVVAHGRPREGDWVAVHGCGGVGLSAVMIAVALGARVLAIDPSPAAQLRANALGAEVAPPEAVQEITNGGAAVSIDAIGGAESLLASVRGLARRGRHVQVGLMGAATTIPVEVVNLMVARELELIGSHGMAAADYGPMLAQVVSGVLDPARLLRRTVSLEAGAELLAELGTAEVDGVTVLRPTL